MKNGPGFTLLEMLVVMGIIAVMAVLLVPTMTRVVRATSLSSSGTMLKDQCLFARQLAQSKNVPVEVRLYRLANYESTNTTPQVYRAFQLFLVGDSTNALDKPKFFKSPVTVSAGTNESAFLIDETDTTSTHRRLTPVATDPKLGIYGTNYDYVAFRFLPSGATDMVSGRNFVTLVLQNDKPLSQGGNFYTVQIDPVNGAVRSFRP